MITKFKKFKKTGSWQIIFFSTLVGILFLIVIGFLVVADFKINKKRADLTARIESLKKEIQILEEKNTQLKAKTSQIGTEEYLEMVAREQLGLKSPGEEVVVIKKEKGEEEKIEKEEKGFWQRILDPVRNFFGDL